MKPLALPRIGKRLGYFALFYLLSYTTLSLFGTYVPRGWGLGWVKFYRWAPAGFASGPAGLDFTPINQTLTFLYYPLLTADNKYIHTPDRARTGKWPVNITLDKALNESYGERIRGLEKQPDPDQ